jgi:hypothetical protein
MELEIGGHSKLPHILKNQQIGGNFGEKNFLYK